MIVRDKTHINQQLAQLQPRNSYRKYNEWWILENV